MVRQADEKMIRVKSITAVSIIAWLTAVIVCFTLIRLLYIDSYATTQIKSCVVKSLFLYHRLLP